MYSFAFKCMLLMILQCMSSSNIWQILCFVIVQRGHLKSLKITISIPVAGGLSWCNSLVEIYVKGLCFPVCILFFFVPKNVQPYFAFHQSTNFVSDSEPMVQKLRDLNPDFKL